MRCVVKMNKTPVQFEFDNTGCKQKILLDMLLDHGEWELSFIASNLNIPIEKLTAVQKGSHFLQGEEADDLAQLFLVFFGRGFFKGFSVVRKYERLSPRSAANFQ